MIKQLPIYLYGSIIILAGVFLLVSGNTSFQFTRTMLGTSLIVGSTIAIVIAFNRELKLVQFAYHELHALALFIYGISVLWLCKSPERLTLFTAFLLIFYAFSEIIFCSWIFNLGQKVYFRVASIRVALGLIIGVGTVVSMNYSEFTIQLYGALFILVGINAILYVPVMKATRIK